MNEGNQRVVLCRCATLDGARCTWDSLLGEEHATIHNSTH